MKPFIPIRLSHSSRDTFLTCERKWQLDKLLTAGYRDQDSEHTVFGRAYGHGVAHYLTYQNKEQALYETWKMYWPEIETDKKDMAYCIIALNNSFEKLDRILETHEIAVFNDKPATELSFRLNISPSYYYVGYIDAVLRNRSTNQYSVFECKSTGLQLLDLDPVYKNSDQALGYSIVLDKIAGADQTDYSLLYFIARLQKNYQVEVLPKYYSKNLQDRLRWFLSLALDVERWKLCEQLNVYPLRGQSCLKYNRPCKYFNECHMTALDRLAERKEDDIVYDFVYSLDEVLADHLSRVKKQPSNITIL